MNRKRLSKREIKKYGSMNFKIIAIICILILALSCATNKPKDFVFIKRDKSMSAVVFPFKNSTKNITISRKIYRIFITRLIKSPIFNPVEEGEIRNFMIKNNIFPGDIPTYQQLHLLKSITNANIIIGGNILQADEKFGDVKIALILWAREIDTGKLLWTTFYTKKGDDYRKIFHFGKVFTFGELSIKMIDDIVKKWEQKGG